LHHSVDADVAPKVFESIPRQAGDFGVLWGKSIGLGCVGEMNAQILGDRPANSSDVVSTREGDIMKSPLQEYEHVTRQMMWISLALFVIGVIVYAMWFGAGALVALIGFSGLVWCFMRR
jgi:hypothetical protein